VVDQLVRQATLGDVISAGAVAVVDVRPEHLDDDAAEVTHALGLVRLTQVADDGEVGRRVPDSTSKNVSATSESTIASGEGRCGMIMSVQKSSPKMSRPPSWRPVLEELLERYGDHVERLLVELP
jgi:hypothetical protein